MVYFAPPLPSPNTIKEYFTQILLGLNTFTLGAVAHNIFLALSRNLRRSDVYTPVLLVLGNMILVMFCGPFAIVFYAVEIFQVQGCGQIP